MAIPQCVIFGGYSDVASVKKISHTDYTDMALLQCVFLGGNKILIEIKSIITMTTLIYLFPRVYSRVMNKIYHNIHINTTCPQYVFDVMWQDFFFSAKFLQLYCSSLRSYFWTFISDLFMKLYESLQGTFKVSLC